MIAKPSILSTMDTAGLLLVLAGAIALGTRIGAAGTGVDLFADDGWYYAIIARNLAATGRPTFDGVTVTNGFHPLLLLLEAAGFALAGLRSSTFQQYLTLGAASCGILFATLSIQVSLASRLPAAQTALRVAVSLTASLLLVPRLSALYVNGMESALVLPLLVVMGGGSRDPTGGAPVCSERCSCSRGSIRCPFSSPPSRWFASGGSGARDGRRFGCSSSSLCRQRHVPCW